MKNLLVPLLLLLFAACSPLQTTVRPQVDWSSISTAELTGDDNRWNLLPVTADKLKDLGLAVIPAGSGAVDVRAVLQVEDTTTLTETGALIKRPKNLTLQLLDPQTGTELARSRYQLSSTQSPRHALDLMITDLDKQIRRGTPGVGAASPPSSAHRAMPVDVPSDANPATESAPPTNAPVTPVPETPLAPPGTVSNKTEKSPWQPRFQGWQLPHEGTVPDEPY